jgi:menaquinone-dependent protoporphyrinogen oxidase
MRPRGSRVIFWALDPTAKPIRLAGRFMAGMQASKDLLPAGDFRDWPAIDAWADEIARELGAPGTAGR